MAKRSERFGIIALGSAFFLISVPYIALIFGGLAILFAFFSKGAGHTYPKDAKTGLWTGCTAITIALIVFLSVLVLLKFSPDYRNSIAQYMDTIYGDTYSEILGDESFSNILNNLFGEGSK